MENSTKSKTEIEKKPRTRCEIWTRTMGYYRPVSYYNIGKKAEFFERKFFIEEVALSNKEFINEFK